MSKYKYEKEFMFSDKKLADVKFFLKDANNLDITQIRDDKQNTILHQCAFQGNISTMVCYTQFALEHWRKTYSQAQIQNKLKIWVNQKNLQGFTAMHYGAYKGYLQILQYLDKIGGNYAIKTNTNLSVLHLAAQGDKAKTFIYFRGKVDINIQDQKKSTPLHWASYIGSQKVVQYLLAHEQIKIDLKDNQGQTALHLATAYGNTKIVRRLLVAGANRKITNNKNLIALQIAQQNEFNNIFRMLNDNYTCLDYVRFFFNVKIKYKPKSRSLVMPLLFCFFYILVVGGISLGLEYHDEYKPIYYCQEGLFVLVIFTYVSLIWNPKRVKQGNYQNILKHYITDFNDQSTHSISSNGNMGGSMSSASSNPPRIADLCFKCVQYKPNRSYHCDTCKVCIEQYDHHCPWINNCVGKKNIVRFIVFLISIFVALIWIFVLALQVLLVIIGDQQDQIGLFDLRKYVRDNTVLMYIFLCVLSLLPIIFVIPLLALIFVQIKNVLVNRTTYERFSKSNQSILSHSQRSFIGKNANKMVNKKEEASLKNCSTMCCNQAEAKRSLLQ